MLDGIIPGMFGDIVSLNPLKMMNALYLDGTPSCRAITCTVTDVNGTPSGTVTKFMVPELEQNLGSCSVASSDTEKALEASEVAAVNARNNPPEEAGPAGAPPAEAFSAYFPSGSYGPKLVAPTDLTPYVTWGLAVCVLLYFVGNKL